MLKCFERIRQLVCHYKIRVREKILDILGITVIKRGRTGIKIYHNILKNYSYNHSEEIYIDPSELYLGFDALKDQYTLCGVRLEESPHYDLMHTIDAGGNVKECDYCQRFANGTLDGRGKSYVSDEFICKMLTIFSERKTIIQNDNEPAIQVYSVAGKYYIADGKHRAALAAYLGKKVRCVIISNDFLKDSCRMWIYQEMKKDANSYRMNIELFERMQ